MLSDAQWTALKSWVDGRNYFLDVPIPIISVVHELLELQERLEKGRDEWERALMNQINPAPGGLVGLSKENAELRKMVEALMPRTEEPQTATEVDMRMRMDERRDRILKDATLGATVRGCGIQIDGVSLVEWIEMKLSAAEGCDE